MNSLIYDVADGVATITLNRPDRMNALTYEMALELIAAFDRVDADDEVRAVIVTGAGDRAFCAGADLSGGTEAFDFDRRKDQPGRKIVNGVYRDSGGMVALRIFECLKPVIGAVNGVAVGFGASVLLPMDIRIAADTARFGFVFARRGIVPESASSWFLPRLVGISRALDWCYSGRIVGADEAHAAGLLTTVHPASTLLSAARALARSYVDHSAPVSVALTRRMMWTMLGAEHPMLAHQIDSRAMMERGKSADAKEGVASFLEKRQPDFPDRISADMAGFDSWFPSRQFE